MKHENAIALIETQFEQGALPEIQAQALRAHLRGCGSCRATYDQAVELERALEGGAVLSRAQLARQMARLPEALAKQRGLPRLKNWGFRIAGLAAAAMVALFVFRAAEDDDGFQGRGGGCQSEGTAWVRVFRKSGDDVSALAHQMDPKDGLLFAYTNQQHSGIRYVAVVGRDARGRVHWYHPAYQTPTDRPSSLSIEPGVADRELPEIVFADHSAGMLEICALFTAEPLQIHELDVKLEAGEPWPEEAKRHCVQVEVQSR